MNDTWIGPGAVVDRCIVDKNVVVGAGTQLGWGDDLITPNEQHPGSVQHRPDHRRQGRAHVPAATAIGRNVVIEADVDEEAFAAFGERRAERRDRDGGSQLMR